MSCNAASKEHLELSEFIKSVHQDLRINSRVVGPEKAWEHHCQNEEVLKKYASAMKTLANDFWSKNNCKPVNNKTLDRIDWVITHCNKYFYLSERQNEINKEISLAEKHEITYDSSIHCFFDVYKDSEKKLKLLDVGSCYNPFKSYDMFDVTAIDLYPASEDVIKCDFLNADIENDVLIKEYYDIVVFSLFLEYLPFPKQRYEACSKSYDILKPTGLLFILTPDSKHATANSKLMKQWRICLSSLGFTRVYYEKLKHLHCMAFKKNCIKELPLKWFGFKNTDNNSADSMIVIPQDFKTDVTENLMCDDHENDLIGPE